MNPRLKLAAENQKVSREIFASLPQGVRIATVLRVILAFGDDSTSLGLAAMTAMAQRGVTGDIFGMDMEDVSKAMRGRGGSQAYKNAKSFGTSIINKGLAQYKNPELRERALQNVQEKLYTGNHDISGSFTVQQTQKYLVKMLWMEASTINRSKEFEVRRDPTQISPDDINQFMSNPRLWAKLPGSALDEVRRELTSKPIFLSEGKPLMYMWIEAQASSSSKFDETAFARELGISVQSWRKWRTNSSRLKALQKVLSPLLEHFEMV